MTRKCVEPINHIDIIEYMLISGFSRNAVQHYCDWIGGMQVTANKIQTVERRLLDEQRLGQRNAKKYSRLPERILRKRSEVQRFTPILYSYCKLAVAGNRNGGVFVDPQLIVTCKKLTQSTVEVDHIFDLVIGMMEGEVFFRTCPDCHAPSLMAMNSLSASNRCTHCDSCRIVTGEVWYPLEGRQQKAG